MKVLKTHSTSTNIGDRILQLGLRHSVGLWWLLIFQLTGLCPTTGALPSAILLPASRSTPKLWSSLGAQRPMLRLWSFKLHFCWNAKAVQLRARCVLLDLQLQSASQRVWIRPWLKTIRTPQLMIPSRVRLWGNCRPLLISPIFHSAQGNNQWQLEEELGSGW